MKKTLFILVCLILLDRSGALGVMTIDDLITDPMNHNGQQVVIEGEVIGDVMYRLNDEVWLHVYDGSLALGVYCLKPALPAITYTGNYKQTGDRIRVEGRLNRSCQQHGGDMDLHAARIELLEAGKAVEKPVNPKKLRAFYILGPLVGLLILLNFKKWW